MDEKLTKRVEEASMRGEEFAIEGPRPKSATDENAISAETIHDIVTGRNGTPHFRGVRLSGLYIVGNLDLSFLEGKGQLALRNCYIEGDVILQEARFTGEIDLDGTRVDHLDIRGATIDGNLLLRSGFRAERGIRGIGLVVTGALRLTDSFVSADQEETTLMAIELFRAKLGDVFLKGTVIKGGLYAAGITVDRNFRLHGTTITSRESEEWAHDGSDYKGAIVLANAEVKGSLYFWTKKQLGFSAQGAINLRMASCRQLFVNKDILMSHSFVLDGLTYDGLNYIERHQMLDVLNANQEPELSRAYVQLASYSAATGDITTRRKALISLEKWITNGLPMSSMTKYARYFYDWLVAYGYRPARAIVWLLALLAIAAVWIHWGVPIFAPKPLAGQPVPDPTAIGWPDSVGMVVDGFLPFTSLGVKDKWVAAPSSVGEWFWLAGFLVLRFLSWGLAALALLSFTSVARNPRG